MLGHYEFKMLPLPEQPQYIWDNGTYLAYLQEEGKYRNLYHLGSFFTEVWYEPESNQITNIRTFTSRGCLEPHLLNISLNGL